MTPHRLMWWPPVVIAWLLGACSSAPMELDTSVVWKRDLPFCIENVGCYEGVSVVPNRQDYSIEIEPKGDANIDLVIFNTCHREEAYEKTSSGWFIFKKKNRFKYYFQPTEDLETRRDCDLKANTLEEGEGRHAWMVMRREHPDYTLPAQVACNGVIKSYNGVSVCQAKVGLIQRIEFGREVQFATPDEGCDMPARKGDGYEWKMSKGECLYVSRDEVNRRHSLLTFGYQGIPIRKED